MTGVRWREDSGFEGQCAVCRQWWPIDREFWSPKHSLRRCRGCYLDSRRPKERARYHANPWPKRTRSAETRAKDRRRKQLERMDPELRPMLLERQRATQARYYERHAPEVRARRREAYERQHGKPRPNFGRPRLDDAA